MRRVLLVDPVFHVHSPVHYRAAVGSDGFEDAQFVIVTGGIGDRDRDRIGEFVRDHPWVELRELGIRAQNLTGRWQSHRAYAESVEATEEILRRESFDFFTYLMFDNALPTFAFPGAKKRLRAHQAVGVRGLLMRDNGLRPPPRPSIKERIRAWGDRLILDRALKSGMIRKLAFYDHRCADRARARYGEVCGRGIDPIEIQPCDPVAAREKIGAPCDAWVALMFGVISARKGVVETLEILAEARTDLRRLLIVLAGPVEKSLRNALEAAVEKARRKFRVLWRDEFIPEPEMPFYFAAADCVICAYQRFNASSGILLQAASHGKPAIVSREGVMQDAIEEFHFGEAVDLAQPKTLVDAVERLMNATETEREGWSAGGRKYASTMEARHYMSQFL
jgi:glycosyltransferase involved in cell wall biosynthesis